MKEVKLTKGLFAQVDDEDFEKVKVFSWYAMKHRNTFYAFAKIRINGVLKTISLHGLILNGKMIDHIDHDTLNCQKYNLRKCTNSQNLMNQLPQKKSSTKFKGIYFYKQNKKWGAKINMNKTSYNLGYFVDEVEAAKAYDKKAKEIFGEFAYLNFR